MFLMDSHTHSNCSPDSDTPMVQMAQAAVQVGMNSLCLTDHCDLFTLDGQLMDTPYNWDVVLEQYEDMLQKFGTKLELPLGLEFGMSFTNPELAKKILSEPQLDFVIGAAHNMSHAAGGRDFYFGDYETEEKCYMALDDYFASLQKIAESDFYDVIAHIIYPLRYMKGIYQNPISLDRYYSKMEDMFRQIIHNGKGIEINTWRGRSIKEWVPILKLYKAAGGEIVTVGSDAHDPSAVGQGIKDSYTMLQDLGFSYVAKFDKRKPIMIKL